MGRLAMVAITAGHHDDMAVSVLIGRPAHDYRASGVGVVEHLVECPVVVPVGVEAKLRGCPGDPDVFQQTELRGDLANGGLDFEYVSDAVMVPIGVENLCQRGR